jgi:hypothetical protein
MKLPVTMGRRLMHKIWPLLLVIGSGILTFLIVSWVRRPTLDALNAAALVSTLVAVVWYTVETRALRLQQEFDSEIRNHPWLQASNLKVDRVDPVQNPDVGLCGRDAVYLPVANVGLTPAHDLFVNVRWELEASLPADGTKKYERIIVAPNDTCHLKLCELDYDDPDNRASIAVEISYKSFLGGGGSFEMKFIKEPGQGWANGPMSPYRFWMSNGRTFPAVS